MLNIVAYIENVSSPKKMRNYTVADLTNLYTKYERNRTNHILLWLAYRKSKCFFFCS